MSTPESTPNTFPMDNPMSESTLTRCQSRLYLPVRNFGFGLCILARRKDHLVGQDGDGLCIINRVSTEFRRHGIPSVFFTSGYSIFRAELAKNSAEFRRIPCHRIPWNSAEFHGISWLFSCTVFRISLPVLDRYFLCVIICVSSKFLSLPFWGCYVY